MLRSADLVPPWTLRDGGDGVKGQEGVETPPWRGLFSPQLPQQFQNEPAQKGWGAS